MPATCHSVPFPTLGGVLAACFAMVLTLPVAGQVPSAESTETGTTKRIALTHAQIEAATRIVATRKEMYDLAQLRVKQGRGTVPTAEHLAWLDARLAASTYRRSLCDLQLLLPTPPADAAETRRKLAQERIAVAREAAAVAAQHHQRLKVLEKAGRGDRPAVLAAKLKWTERLLVELAMQQELLALDTDR